VSEYVERECARCLDGVIHVGGPTEVKTTTCPHCGGTGEVRAFLYPKPKGRRGLWPPEEAAAEARRTSDPL
jgi:ribosomal protein S27AE